MHSLQSFLDQRLLAHQQRLRRLSVSLWAVLPGELLGRCTVTGISEHGILTVLADSAAWATRVRFHERDILRHAGGEISDCRRIKVIVRPPDGKTRAADHTPTRKPLRLTRQNAAALEQLAASESDENLARALARLASRR